MTIFEQKFIAQDNYGSLRPHNNLTQTKTIGRKVRCSKKDFGCAIIAISTETQVLQFQILILGA